MASVPTGLVVGVPTHHVPRYLCADALPFDFICVQWLRLNIDFSLQALITSGTMLSTLWNSATTSPLARLAVPSPAPSSSTSPVASPASSNPAETGTPFTDFVLSRLPDEESQKLFALSFGEHLRRDPDALDLNFEDVHHWLGIPLKANALRLLKRELNAEEYLFIRDDEKSNGRPKDIYKISFNQFEELMIAAQTVEGRKARKLVLLLKRILQEYMVAELEQRSAALEALRLSESARANALQQQLDGLRAQQQHLYVFRLFGNRFKIGIAKDVDRRIRQHSTSCPSGHLVYSVPISCKAMEKLFESTMKQHGAWIKMEEYELSLSDTQIKALFDCFARVEELLNITPLDEYSTLVGLFDHSLRSRTISSSGVPPEPPQDHVHGPLEDSTEGLDVIALFERMYIARGTKDDHFKLKEAEAKWPHFVCNVENSRLGLTSMDMIKPDKEELRQLLQSRLLTPCPKDSRLIGRSHHKSAFRGWKLLDHARPLQ